MTAAPKSRLQALDVMRGCAILLVMLRHGWPQVFQGAGIVGVVVFFVLSGYLITGVLIRDIATEGRIRYRRFYAHRAFRLLPALLAFLACYSMMELSFGVLGDREDGTVGVTLLAAITYITDLPLPFHVSQAIAPLWTLAVEEQFYLIWPALLAYAVRRGRQFALVTITTVVVLVLMIVSVIAVLAIAPDRFNHVYSLPTTWGVGLVIGSAARVFRDRAMGYMKDGRTRNALTYLSIAVLSGLCFFPNANVTPLFYILGGPLIVAAATFLVLAASGGAALPALLSPLRALGTISYAAYLWNYAILLWLNDGRAVDAPWWASTGSFVLTVVVAAVSWFTVERLGRHARRAFDRRYELIASAASSARR